MNCSHYSGAVHSLGPNLHSAPGRLRCALVTSRLGDGAAPHPANPFTLPLPLLSCRVPVTLASKRIH